MNTQNHDIRVVSRNTIAFVVIRGNTHHAFSSREAAESFADVEESVREFVAI